MERKMINKEFIKVLLEVLIRDKIISDSEYRRILNDYKKLHKDPKRGEDETIN